MLVRAIDDTEDGGRQVLFAPPDAPEKTLAMVFGPAGTSDHPDIAFAPGQIISFQPSAQGTGWTLHDEAGTALLFVPLAGRSLTPQTAVF